MLQMILKSSAVNQYIVEEHNHEAAKARSQSSVHRCTRQSKSHHIEFILPQMCLKCSLMLFSKAASRSDEIQPLNQEWRTTWH